MACDEGQIHALFDGELDSSQELAVRRHLKGCARCQTVQRELNWLHGALNDTPPAQTRRAPRALLRAAVLMLLLLGGHRLLLRPPALQPPLLAAAYQVELHGQTHRVDVQGAELLEFSAGDTTPGQPVNLERARIR